MSGRVIFAKACQLALSEARLQSEVVEGLITQASELLQASPITTTTTSSTTSTASSNTEETATTTIASSPLFEALGEEIAARQAQLQSLLDEARAVTGTLDLHSPEMLR